MAALHHLAPNTCVKAESCVFEDIEQESFLVMKLDYNCDETKKKTLIVMKLKNSNSDEIQLKL